MSRPRIMIIGAFLHGAFLATLLAPPVFAELPDIFESKDGIPKPGVNFARFLPPPPSAPAVGILQGRRGNGSGKRRIAKMSNIFERKDDGTQNLLVKLSRRSPPPPSGKGKGGKGKGKGGSRMSKSSGKGKGGKGGKGKGGKGKGGKGKGGKGKGGKGKGGKGKGGKDKRGKGKGGKGNSGKWNKKGGMWNKKSGKGKGGKGKGGKGKGGKGKGKAKPVTTSPITNFPSISPITNFPSISPITNFPSISPITNSPTDSPESQTIGRNDDQIEEEPTDMPETSPTADPSIDEPPEDPTPEPTPLFEACAPSWIAENELLRVAKFDRWSRPPCYEFVFERQCFCERTYVGPFRVLVRDGAIVEAYRIAGSEELSVSAEEFDLITIEQMYAEIENVCYAQCPREGPFACEVVFDDRNGSVESVFVDPIFRISDDELRYTVTDFKLC